MSSSDVAAKLDDFRARFMKLFETGELKALSLLYAEDCIIMTPGVPMQTGRDAILKTMEKMKAAGIAKVIITGVEIGGGGDVAYECCENSYQKDDGTVVDVKKMLAVFKKVDGAYYIHAVCLNSNEAGPKP